MTTFGAVITKSIRTVNSFSISSIIWVPATRGIHKISTVCTKTLLGMFQIKDDNITVQTIAYWMHISIVRNTVEVVMSRQINLLFIVITVGVWTSFFLFLNETWLIMAITIWGDWEDLQGKQQYQFHFSFLYKVQLLKGRICSCRCKFFPLIVDSIWKVLIALIA